MGETKANNLLCRTKPILTQIYISKKMPEKEISISPTQTRSVYLESDIILLLHYVIYCYLIPSPITINIFLHLLYIYTDAHHFVYLIPIVSSIIIIQLW